MFDEELIGQQAEMVHASTKLICGTPKLLVSYMNAMVSDSFIDQPPPEPEEEFPSIITER